MNASRRMVLGVALGAILAGGCGAADPGQGGGPSAAAGETHVERAAGGDASPVTIQAGRYKVAWTSSCQSLTIKITDATGKDVYTKTSRIKAFSAIASNLPAGPVTITQADAACTDWKVTIDRIG